MVPLRAMVSVVGRSSRPEIDKWYTWQYRMTNTDGLVHATELVIKAALLEAMEEERTIVFKYLWDLVLCVKRDQLKLEKDPPVCSRSYNASCTFAVVAVVIGLIAVFHLTSSANELLAHAAATHVLAALINHLISEVRHGQLWLLQIATWWKCCGCGCCGLVDLLVPTFFINLVNVGASDFHLLRKLADNCITNEYVFCRLDGENIKAIFAPDQTLTDQCVMYHKAYQADFHLPQPQPTEATASASGSS